MPKKKNAAFTRPLITSKYPSCSVHSTARCKVLRQLLKEALQYDNCAALLCLSPHLGYLNPPASAHRENIPLLDRLGRTARTLPVKLHLIRGNIIRRAAARDAEPRRSDGVKAKGSNRCTNLFRPVLTRRYLRRFLHRCFDAGSTDHGQIIHDEVRDLCIAENLCRIRPRQNISD